ncbi:DUF808 domain-containing protein [Zunongwangia profunda]|uniref:Membrane protein n=2 Tax=Zunongwangia profunda TaxID=398743 RepID=D5BI00_ZUNPS|nr:DUF808 domain-containing protein [Zunongwangia profunda]ADF51388.1 membrane protein [Zunongwangia profunda SM-A87]MAS69621.1 DUF808 domain-containing protein [Zunongwangia sp.]HCV80091.1 DUF808 domain-containing protein [Zunongwangia profunda]|tara:strand:+ start:3563 stop:4438 length:876 start_codon:yes stop_codon:yes gene_type:complete
MASGFFALLDDIAALMDDVSVMSKVAGKKTAGLLGDDLAVNAEKASGFVSSRELPVLWKITKGSLLNKLIILPLGFLLSAFLPSVIHIILLIGGLYLAYEGAEKIYEFFFPHKEHKKIDRIEKLSKEEILAREKEKVKSAILTDFILSVEIVIVALGTVEEAELPTKIIVVSLIAILATVGVYGIVALIVRMDDFGRKLINLNAEDDSFSDKVGKFLVSALPKVIKGLSVLGTIALMLVSGGIFVHNLEFLHGIFPKIPSFITEFFVGLIVGFIVLLIVKGISRIIKSFKK